MKKKLVIVLWIIILIVLCRGILNNLAKNRIDDTDTIKNEAYYQEKQQEFWHAEDEYEEELSCYIDAMFTGEELDVLSKCDQELIENANGGDKKKIKVASAKKSAYIKEFSQKEFTEEQLKKLEEIDEKIEELKPIVDEYVSKQDALEEKQFWEGRETLKDGSVINVRESVISDKECDGWKFTNLSMRYLPKEKVTKFGATVTNSSDEVKEGKVSVKITGDCETIFPLQIERLEPGESYDFEIENGDDISMAGTLEIVPYDEKDYEM